MTYIAHYSEDKTRSQSVKDHCMGVAALAGNFADAFGYGEWGYCAGILHDIGKYSDAFAKRIEGAEIKVDHSTAGAQVCLETGGLYSGLAYCIAGHHAGLPDTGEKSDTPDRGTLCGRRKRKVEDYQAYKNELEIPPLHKMPFHAAQKEKDTFVLGFFLRMIYSCLVDADFLDTESFMKNGVVKRDSGETISVLCGKLQNKIAEWLRNEDLTTINGRRSQILKNCLDMADGDRGLFKLTVPTGGGKTIASLAFALEHAREHGMDRVIYVIPYTSIIEQNAQVFRDILGGENVLENHYNVEYGDGEEFHPMQLAAENWDKPVVVTTNVQFFESLFSNKSSRCRKLHNMANSVIIFDEVQMLPNDYLKPCVEVMEDLARYCKSSVVLCTATQPALEHFFADDIKARELCPDPEEQFRFFKRVTMENDGIMSEDELVGRLKSEDQALCILNTKNLAQKIYARIKEDSAHHGVFHLSTSMYPRDRKKVLSEIRGCLARQEKCIVVSTSLVEAGVDLDFKAVYRQLAGMDSVVQAAGRCNREGRYPADESITHVFQLEDAGRVMGQEQQIAVAKQVMADQEDLSSPEAIREYFELLYHYRGDSLDAKNILGQFCKGRFPFAKVGGEFRLIEQNTRTIFIPIEEEAARLLDEARMKGLTKTLMQKMGQYCVSVYEYNFRELEGCVSPLSEKFGTDVFVLDDTSCYKDDTGLVGKVETGMAILL